MVSLFDLFTHPKCSHVPDQWLREEVAVLLITSRWQKEENSSSTRVFVSFFQMHLHYIEEGKVPPESNGPVEPVGAEHTASSPAPAPAPATGQTASGKDRGKKKKK